MRLKAALKAALKRAPQPHPAARRSDSLMRAFKISRAEQRHHRHRDDVGSEERNHHRQRHRRKQKLADAGQQRDREEHHGGRQRGREHRKSDFLSAGFGGHARRFAHFQMAIDVFEHDHGVVDQAR